MANVDRRDFIKLGAAAAVASVVGAEGLAGQQGAESRSARALPTVAFGKTARTLPRLGLGCFPVGNLASPEQASAVLKKAYEMGIRYFDTAPSYAAGVSESRVGAALKGYPRSEYFIATKTLERKAAGARSELEQSLKRLGMSYVDMVQVHEIHDDWESLLAEGSVISGLEKARSEGLVQWIGITCHRDPVYLSKAFERYEFTSTLVPVNPLDAQHLSFSKEWLPVAAKKGIATIAMKIFAGGQLVREKKVTPKECLRYAFAQKHATILVPGCDTVEQIEEAVAVALEPPATAEWCDELVIKAGKHRGKESEWYKNTKRD
jgi:aryl-alcohol dehydrogenase-like predicted oxidoreductase